MRATTYDLQAATEALQRMTDEQLATLKGWTFRGFARYIVIGMRAHDTVLLQVVLPFGTLCAGDLVYVRRDGSYSFTPCASDCKQCGYWD